MKGAAAPITTFTGWNAQGVPHQMQHVPSVYSDTASLASNATVVPAPAKNSNWAKVVWAQFCRFHWSILISSQSGRKVDPVKTTPVVIHGRGYESESDDEM